MYGLVNRAIKDCILDGFGSEVWARVEKRSQTDASHYVSMTPYPDELTLSIIGAACEELETDAGTLLRTFGRFWVMNTANLEYSDLMALGGSDLKTFLINLDQMHEQVAITFQNLRQPSFTLEETDGYCLLHYRSERDGLTEFVVGLLHGLSEHFQEPLQIEQLKSKAGGDDHDVFRLEFTA